VTHEQINESPFSGFPSLRITEHTATSEAILIRSDDMVRSPKEGSLDPSFGDIAYASERRRPADLSIDRR
jgi:hypothetical protein